MCGRVYKISQTETDTNLKSGDRRETLLDPQRHHQSPDARG